MSEPRQTTAVSRARGPRLGLKVELRRTAAGPFHHAPSADHALSVHAGAPVRVSCHNSQVRSVRTRGEISLMPAGSSDDWFEDEASDMLELRLPSALVRLAAEEMGLDPDRAGIEPQYHFRDAQIEHIAWALEAECRANFANGLLYSESLGMALAVHLLARYRADAPPRAGLSRPQLERVTAYVEAHLGQDLSLLRLARVAGVSASHFRALFKRSTGLPVHEYVIQRRVERARALLSRGELPASQIALDAGFSHQSHMARCMRRVLGVTPTVVARHRALSQRAPRPPTAPPYDRATLPPRPRCFAAGPAFAMGRRSR
jgi:AraC family transcriptional regulator